MNKKKQKNDSAKDRNALQEEGNVSQQQGGRGGEGRRENSLFVQQQKQKQHANETETAIKMNVQSVVKFKWTRRNNQLTTWANDIKLHQSASNQL